VLVLVVVDVEEEASSGGRGRKLHDPEGRWETRLKISVMRRCWMVVSYVRGLVGVI